MKRYYNDRNELAVLVSPGYGAGWSSWYENKAIATDKRVVEAFMSDKTEAEMKEFLERIGYKNVYMGGYVSLTIKWIPKGTRFRIIENDGFETVEKLELSNWDKA